MSQLSVKPDRQKIVSALAGLRSEKIEDKTEFTEYNLLEPHYFNKSQLDRVSGFMKKIAVALELKLNSIYNIDFSVTAELSSQHFACELLDPSDDSSYENDYFMAMGPDADHPFGLFGIPAATAASWITQSLGDTDGSGESFDLEKVSQLEESLLVDRIYAIISTFSSVFPENIDVSCFESIRNITKDMAALDGLTEYCKVGLSFAISEDQKTEAYIIIPCSILDKAVTKKIPKKINRQQVSNSMMNHFMDMPVTATVHLSECFLSTESILCLQPGDIVLLDRKVGEPVELNVGKDAILRGELAKSGGKFAVIITNLCCNES